MTRVGSESMQNGYMLSYYLMDLRNQDDDKASDHSSRGHTFHGGKEMEMPFLLTY